MALVFIDLAQETTSTSGTGTLTLTGAVAGFQSLAAIGDGNTSYFRIKSGLDSEVFLGTYTASGTTLSRDTVLSSIIAGVTGTTKITVTAGATVFPCYPAERAIILDSNNNSTALGTITSANLSNCISLPLDTGVSGYLRSANGGTGLTSTGTVGNVLTSDGTNWVSSTPIALSGLNIFTNTQTLSGSATAFGTVLTNASETVNIVATAPPATTNLYLYTGSVHYYSVAATANWVLNIAFSSTATLNSSLVIGQLTTVAFMVLQGATAFYNSSITIDGTVVTPYWQGGTAPTKGYISGIDVYTYTITKTAASTYVVLASQTQF